MKKLACLLLCTIFTFTLCACSSDKNIKIGVSIGAGPAARWEKEKVFMEQRAAELGIAIDARLNREDSKLTQTEECIQLIDSGISALILMPRDAKNSGDIVEYAKKKKVPVISYSRLVQSPDISLLVGYDSHRIGQRMGQYLSEAVPKGDYILLKGDANDNNAELLHSGAMRYIEPILDKINVILQTNVPGWSPDEAKKLVIQAVKDNDNKIDAILAPNDKIAGACAEALAELGIEKEVIITGMDADLEAAQRIINDKQGCTFYMDLKDLAYTAFDEAVNFAKGDKVNINAEFPVGDGEDAVDANLITGQLITKDNLDKFLIDSGYYDYEDIYGN